MTLEVDLEVDVPARMRDGVTLRANVYRPRGQGRYPVLLSRQPYDKNSNINPVYADPRELAAAGYLVVMQDVRGRYASDGDFDPGDQELEDGYDTVEWAARLPGAGGLVGLWGRSYHAETQWRAAVRQPPALRSLVAGVSKVHHNHEGQERPGGAHEGSRLVWHQVPIGPEALRRRWADDPVVGERYQRQLTATTARLASGELFDRLPLRDLAELPGSEMAEAIAAMDRPPDAPVNRWPWPADTYDRVQADTFHIGGWYDIFTRGTLDQYQAMAAVAARSGRRPPPAARRGPGRTARSCAARASWTSGRTPTEPTSAAPAACSPNTCAGSTRRSRVTRRVWPGSHPYGCSCWVRTAGAASTAIPSPVLRSRTGTCNRVGGSGAPRRHRATPTGSTTTRPTPVPTRGGSTMLPPRWPPGPYDQREIEARPDVLSYTSAPLTSPCTVVGAVSVTLYAATSAADTDFVARLVDVHPDGRAINLADGIIRLSQRDRYPGPGQTCPASTREVLPGQPYPLSIDLQATAVTFLVGHRIRVDVTSSSHPRWIRHTNTAAHPLDATELVVATQQIHHDPQRPSRIHLSVLAESDAPSVSER